MPWLAPGGAYLTEHPAGTFLVPGGVYLGASSQALTLLPLTGSVGFTGALGRVLSTTQAIPETLAFAEAALDRDFTEVPVEFRDLVDAVALVEVGPSRTSAGAGGTGRNWQVPGGAYVNSVATMEWLLPGGAYVSDVVESIVTRVTSEVLAFTSSLGRTGGSSAEPNPLTDTVPLTESISSMHIEEPVALTEVLMQEHLGQGIFEALDLVEVLFRGVSSPMIFESVGFSDALTRGEPVVPPDVAVEVYTGQIAPRGGPFVLPIRMVESADHTSGASGRTLVLSLAKNGGLFDNPVEPLLQQETGNGWYTITFLATHLDTLGPLVLLASATDADSRMFVMQVAYDVPGKISIVTTEAAMRIAAFVKRITPAFIEAENDAPALTHRSDYGQMAPFVNRSARTGTNVLVLYREDKLTELGRVILIGDPAAAPITETEAQ